MAVGAISIVAPIAGAGAAIPVAVGLATGDRPSALQLVGFAAAIVGVVLSSWERSPGRSGWAAGAGFGIVAMVGFGLYFVFLHMASTDDFLWPAFLFRVVSASHGLGGTARSCGRRWAASAAHCCVLVADRLPGHGREHALRSCVVVRRA